MNSKLNGYKRDCLDPRDYKYVSSLTASAKPIDLRAVEPSVVDQGDLGSCTACATTSLVKFVRKKLNLSYIDPSVLFTYYTTRQIEKTIPVDCGATLRNSIKSTVNYGITESSLFPYTESEFATKPSDIAYEEALKHQTLSYYRITNAKLSNLQNCLKEGYPFVFGFAVYSNMWTQSATAGARIQLPNYSKDSYEGGHAVMAVGWETYKNKPWFIIKNSWGTSWGNHGYFRLPADYLTNTKLSNDFWTIRLTEN
jgi:C1A family cysteine protease